MKNPKPPSELQDLQTWVSQIIRLPFSKMGEYDIPEYETAILESIDQHIADGPILTASQRIGIYNQQYWWRLYHIMQSHYPGLLRIFGSDEFNSQISKPYLMKYPPNDWSLHNLGERLTQWIEEEYQQDDKAFVLNMAKIDAAYQKIWHTPMLKSQRKISADVPLFLSPSVKLLEMQVDLMAFRFQLMQEEKDYWVDHPFPEIPPFKKKHYFALFYEDFEPRYKELSNPEYQILKTFEKGCSVINALTSTNDVSEEKIGIWFQEWAKEGWI